MSATHNDAGEQLAPDGRPLDPGSRSQLFGRGFGDGARGSAYRHEGYPDYMQGWKAGAAAAGHARAAFDLSVGHLSSPLRGPGPGVSR